MPAAPRIASLPTRMLNMLVTPGEVFDQVVAAPPRLANALVPTLLVVLTSLLLLVAASQEAGPDWGEPDTAEPAAAQAEAGTAAWQRVSALAAGGGAVAGTFWSALLLWFIGRVFLKARFPLWKAVEVVALSGVIVALGSIVTALLVTAASNPASRPALSLLAPHLAPTSRFRMVLDTANFFYLWSTVVLAIGLSRLSGVSFKECAFWVFGYWLAARLALILLA